MSVYNGARRAFADASTERTSLLEFTAVQARYGTSEALFSDLSIQVSAGEIVALRGRSGSGKSTALAVAMGVRPPTDGQVWWCGADLYALDEDERSRVRLESFGIVLQDGGLLHGLTALENVLVPVLRRRAREEDRQRAREALALVGLAERGSHTPERMSGGECQRVALARALFAEPRLLIVDEPTSSLDRASADLVIDLLVQAASAGRAVLVASHDPGVIDAAHRFHDIEPPYRPRRHALVSAELR